MRASLSTPRWRCCATAACSPIPPKASGAWVATARVPRWITGAHAGVALRASAHPVVAALCNALGGPLVSTSANTAGAPAPRRIEALEPAIRDAVDGCVEGETGGREGPSDIRDARNGAVLR